VLELFPETKSGAMKKSYEYKDNGNSMGKATGSTKTRCEASQGSAARFFYCPKASKKDRNEGVEWMKCTGDPSEPPVANNHPTVKPTALMAYLCRLITPAGGVVLDPYMGSGSTGKAAVQEGFSFVGCELDKDYFDIATARVANEEDLEVRGEDF
jgi:site-specific DNA-methyltransferase (adenine-specific)